MGSARVPQTSQELLALVDDEQRRQDTWLSTIRALAKDSQELKLAALDDDEAAAQAKPGLIASLSQRLKGRRAEQGRKASVEDRLRARIEQALKETKKASLLVDRFAALREGLFLDLERLHTLIAEGRGEEAKASARVVAARLIADDESKDEHERDSARAERTRAESTQDLCSRTCERLAVVVASARGLLDVIDTLSADVSSFARAAERELDQLSARARALSAAEDAKVVVEELERSLLVLSGSLDEVTAFASAVHERVGLASSATELELLVKSALARRAATQAKEQAAGS